MTTPDIGYDHRVAELVCALLDGIDGDVDDYIGGMLHALTGTDPIEAFSALMWMAAAMTQRVAEVTGFDSRQVVDSWLQARYKD